MSLAQIFATISLPNMGSINELCELFMKTYAATVKLLKYNPETRPYKQSLKACFSDLYQENLH